MRCARTAILNPDWAGRLRVFILGSYRSIDGSQKDFQRLRLLERHLKESGYDSFLAVSRKTIDGLDLRKFSPRQKTLQLAGFADLNLFLFTLSGIRDGLVAELTELQTRYPGLSWKHVVLLEEGLALSSILDEVKGGVLSLSPVKQMVFLDDQDLLEIAQQVAFNFAFAKKRGVRP